MLRKHFIRRDWEFTGIEDDVPLLSTARIQSGLTVGTRLKLPFEATICQ